MAKKIFKDEIDVLKYQRDKVNTLSKCYSELENEIDDLEEKIQQFMASRNINKSKIDECILESKSLETQNNEIENIKENVVFNKSFDDLIYEANLNGYSNIDILEIATKEEIYEANNILKNYYSKYTDQYKMDKYDYAIAGIIGSIAAFLDYFLVTKVNGKNVMPGNFKDYAENFWNKILSPDKIKELEDKYKVTYDVSSNTSKISQEVLGLCPLYHRFQSLGHDPIIGFIFGVADLMKGQLTAIDGNGRLIIQSVDGASSKSFIESVITVFGHFLSDVGTKSKTGKILSVPAPLTPLLQLIQKGSIEYNGQNLTVADLSKKMYYDGYNFNHFIGMSLPLILIEVLTRLSFVIKEMFFYKKDVSLKNNPKLTVMLCIANGILFAENAGKLVITKNPLSINYVSWLSMAKYGFKTFKWMTYDMKIGKVEYAQEYIDSRWQYMMLSAIKLDENTSVYYVN